mmetsp:Transcript_15546/g.32905  ORF Transcript_15546/g.32905 Transcript_15546/m.32905 type:complete len:651 (+) Transcript_15546:139-2091(+)
MQSPPPPPPPPPAWGSDGIPRRRPRHPVAGRMSSGGSSGLCGPRHCGGSGSCACGPQPQQLWRQRASEEMAAPPPGRRRRGGGRARGDREGIASASGEHEGLGLADKLAEQLGRGSYECMICLEKVARSAAIWSCRQCSAAFHLRCIHGWIHRSSDQQQEVQWQCPGCRYHHVGAMPSYECFCGKMSRPEPSPHSLAHSCGDVCERNRGCSHPCPELCHPGPCPPCGAVGAAPGACHCGRESRGAMRCGAPLTWSCGEPCGRALSCGRHACSSRCHSGPCPPCTATSTQRCHCGAEEREGDCGQFAFGCGKTCGQPLSCGEHACERPCHAGECGPCPREPSVWGDSCGCGRMANCQSEAMAARLCRWVGKRQHCTDPLPLCSSLCGRRHEGCGHLCRQRCHEGPCDDCKGNMLRECACKRTSREVACSEEPQEVRCAQICRTQKSCGRHRCSVACCPAFGERDHEAHLCLKVCGKALGCGRHQCEEFCHLGKCPPCRVLLREAPHCACGRSQVSGASPPLCGTEPPKCEEPCAAVLDCGHKCPERCHFGSHPLCLELVSRRCPGGHREMPRQPCHAKAVPCGRPCGRRLPCGHSCAAACHVGECPPCSRELHGDGWEDQDSVRPPTQTAPGTTAEPAAAAPPPDSWEEVA